MNKRKCGRLPETPETCIDRFCDILEESLAPRTVKGYRQDLKRITRVLEENNKHTMPWDITESDVNWLLGHYKSEGMTVSTRRSYMSSLRQYTEYYGNPLISQMRIRWPHDDRPNVDWITEEQAKKLLSLPMTPVQELVIHCELCLGMRRIEVLRLKPSSFKGGFVDILGKGTQGGKPRLMPYNHDTQRVFDRYMDYRNSIISVAVQKAGINVPIPENLLIYSKGSALYAYNEKGSGIDSLIKPLADQIDTHFSNHTLRRTFGRIMFRCDVDVVVISKMLGHESIEMTLKYIGANLDDMGSAMSKFRL